MRFYWVPQALIGINNIAIAPADFRSRQNASFLQMSNHSKRRALRNTDTLCDIAKPGIGILRQANEYVGVVTEEIPIVIGVTHGSIIRHSIQDMTILFRILPESH